MIKEEPDWAEEELGGVDLGDARLSKRVVNLARALAQSPDSSLPQALPKWGDLKAAYRFFDNAKVVPERILEKHIEATYRRMREVPVVLAVQDTTFSIGNIIRRPKGWGRFRREGGEWSVTVRWPSRRSD
jgi:hypothetical protein